MRQIYRKQATYNLHVDGKVREFETQGLRKVNDRQQSEEVIPHCLHSASKAVIQFLMFRNRQWDQNYISTEVRARCCIEK